MTGYILTSLVLWVRSVRKRGCFIMQPGPANHLIVETSPYLLQHAYNPVDWYPWGEEAFERARREDKPIFLSIGYSTCHWCHVMEHESFEDASVAELLNAGFISVKLDREQRPDLDHVYMSVTQALTGSGGWPNTLLLTPDRKPFFAGTYFTKDQLIQLLDNATQVWKKHRKEIETSAAEITSQIILAGEQAVPGDISLKDVELGAASLMRQFDQKNGGFGTRPKFPQPTNLILLLRAWHETGRAEYLAAVEKTIRSMRSGGVYDQIGYGIHRYSTDATWTVPHFEKMLYDQALFAYACVETYQATGDSFYRRVADEILTCVDRDLSDPRGGFYSAQDADSEGSEGKYYVWTERELEATLGVSDAEFARSAFRTSSSGNFEDSGSNVLELAENIDPSDARLLKIQQILLAARTKRVPPQTDDTVHADWNGLMIAAYAKAGAAFGEERWTKRAQNAAGFILGNLIDADDNPLHQWRGGKAVGVGGLDDYAFMLWGLVELYQADFDPKWLEESKKLAQAMRGALLDEDRGGFFMIPLGDKYALTRPKSPQDSAIPSGNAIASYNLMRLGRLLGDPETERLGQGALTAFGAGIGKSLYAYPCFAIAADYLHGNGNQVVVSSPTAGGGSMLAALRAVYSPRAVFALKVPESETALESLVPYTKDMKPVDGKATAYICRNGACDLPTTDTAKAAAILRQGQKP